MSALGTAAARRFRAEARAWLADNVAALDGDREDDAVRRDWDRRLYAAGYAGLSWPAEHGGRGLTVLEEFIFQEEAARAGAPEPYGRVGRLLAGPMLIAHGTDDQRRRFLPPMLSGAEIWCQGFSEPGAGSDLAGIRTRAARDGGAYRIEGQKVWTSFARDADFCMLLARTDDDAPRHRNLGMFCVDMRQDGIEVRPIRQISGGSTFCEVFFSGATVPVDLRVGGATDGWRIAMSVLTDERGPIEGITRYLAFADALRRLEDGRGDDVRELRTRAEVVRWHALRALELRVAGRDDAESREVGAVLKLMWSELWQDLTRYGISRGRPEDEEWWRQEYLVSRGGTIFSGTSQIQRNLIAERLLGLPR